MPGWGPGAASLLRKGRDVCWKRRFIHQGHTQVSRCPSWQICQQWWSLGVRILMGLVCFHSCVFTHILNLCVVRFLSGNIRNFKKKLKMLQRKKVFKFGWGGKHRFRLRFDWRFFNDIILLRPLLQWFNGSRLENYSHQLFISTNQHLIYSHNSSRWKSALICIFFYRLSGNSFQTCARSGWPLCHHAAWMRDAHIQSGISTDINLIKDIGYQPWHNQSTVNTVSLSWGIEI